MTLRAEILPGSLADMEAEFRDYLKRLRDGLRSERGTVTDNVDDGVR
jgi:hypothetical protein